MNERVAPSRRVRMLLVAGAVALWVGVAAALTAAAPSYSDWSTPVNLGPTINTTFVDTSPTLSKDDLSLYFNSNRPGGFGGNDIWVSQRDSVDDDWGAPVNLGPTINTASGEAVPTFSRDGHWMFFASFSTGGFGGEDIWASYRPQIHDDFGWQAPINLGPNINTASGEGSPGYFENDDGGAPQLFFASLRPGGLGSADVWMSERQADGSWGPATPITELNSSASDTRTSISHDGLEIYLQSGRAGGLGGDDLWVATRDTVDAPWSSPVNVGAPVNTSANDVRPYLSADRETLFFASDRPGGSGGTDLWMTTRSKRHGHE